MPTLVHLADERDAKKILNAGIKIGKGRNGIFFMPVIPDFYITHQWLRELKRRGVRTYIGVYFKLNSDKMVWAGKYYQQHSQITLGNAINEFMNLEDKSGYEFIIERKIEPKEIRKIRHLPQIVGWRHMPDSHLKGLHCACPVCISPGDINSRKKREKIEPTEKVRSYNELLERLKTENNEDEIDDIFWEIRRKKRRDDPEKLRFLIDKENTSILISLAIALAYYKHENAIKMLLELCIHEDAEVRQYSAESIIEIDKETGIRLLSRFDHDKVIKEVIQENK
uniref:HEAT repeat domain-containing protein n=1 Tax=Roseihalotalea indica TaxID=2867963 RepID=A0AA49GKA3_9BACT|nr:HEAT repeat domain-containing protein [Tunicatimonas sp. TK19036]